MSKKIFLITGGTNGIGFHAAQEIAKTKNTVIITGKNALKGKNKLNEIRRNTGNEDVHFIIGDLSSQIEIKSIAEFVKRKFSNIDVKLWVWTRRIHKVRCDTNNQEGLLQIRHWIRGRCFQTWIRSQFQIWADSDGGTNSSCGSWQS